MKSASVNTGRGAYYEIEKLIGAMTVKPEEDEEEEKENNNQ